MKSLITLSLHLRRPGASNRNAMRRLVAFLLAAAFACALFGAAEAAILYDSGQTKCYQSEDPYAEIPCYSTGQDGEYTFAPLNYTATSSTVTDNNTGLLWQRQDDGATRTWSAANTYCNGLSLGGYNTGWRLPSNQELMGLVDYSGGLAADLGPAINTIYFMFPVSQSQFDYWTSTADVNVSNSAWYTNFSNGSTGSAAKTTSGIYLARCVHGTQLAYDHFGNNGDGTVTDQDTGLMWQRAEVTNTTWGDSLSYCNTLSLAGRKWRLPSIRELTSLVDYSLTSPAMNTTIFSYSGAETYWSATTDTSAGVYAWFVYILTGALSTDPKTNPYWTKCVTCSELPVWISGTAYYYSAVQTGYNNITGGQTLQIQSQPFTGNLSLLSRGAIAIKGGYNCDYSSNNGFSTIHGNVTVGTGTSIEVEKIIIQ